MNGRLGLVELLIKLDFLLGEPLGRRLGEAGRSLVGFLWESITFCEDSGGPSIKKPAGGFMGSKW